MKQLVLALGLCLVVGATSINVLPSYAQAYSMQWLWTNPMGVMDAAVSKDGNYVAAVNFTGLYFFASSSSAPVWWYLNQSSEVFLSVAISASGEHVIVGNNTEGSIYYFSNSTLRSGLQASGTYNWTSVHFSGYPVDNVERGTIDISDNGEYVVVGGTGVSLYYFVDCTSKSGPSQVWDWACDALGFVETVDMSADGKYVAVGGPFGWPPGPDGFVAFFTNANVQPYPLSYKWLARSTGSIEWVFDVAVSDDGYGVVAVSPSIATTLYCWTDASHLSGDPNPNWTRLHDFSSVDISSDGDDVVAGLGGLVASLHFWNATRTRTLADEPETWVNLEELQVLDVGISDDGNIIAATTYNVTSLLYQVYFYTSSAELIGSYAMQSEDYFLSMSGDGHIVAVGGGALPLEDSLAVFAITGLTPVGGEIFPPNIFELLAPYLLALALAITGTALFVFRRFHKQPLSSQK
jgi:hypothetical protein